MREVRCLSDDMLSSEACDEQLRPAEREDCSPEPCIPHIGQPAFITLSGILLIGDEYILMISASLGRYVHCSNYNVELVPQKFIFICFEINLLVKYGSCPESQ